MVKTDQLEDQWLWRGSRGDDDEQAAEACSDPDGGHSLLSPSSTIWFVCPNSDQVGHLRSQPSLPLHQQRVRRMTMNNEGTEVMR